MDINCLEPSELGYLEANGYTSRDLELLDPIEVGFLLPEMTNEEKLFYAGLAFQSKKQAEAEAQRAEELERQRILSIERELAASFLRDLAEMDALGNRQRSRENSFRLVSIMVLIGCIALTTFRFIWS